jgi:hypothetical protein
MPIHIDTKYINLVSPRLERFAWKKPNHLAVCRCPICGDSKKNANICRFYFYERKGSFSVKCHNCDYGASLGWFLKGIDGNLHREYSFEMLRESGGRTPARAGAPAPVRPRPRTREDGLLSQVPNLCDLALDHPAVTWARGRRIPSDRMCRLHYAEAYGTWAKGIDPELNVPDEARVVIPIIDHEGRLVGAQGRIILTMANRNAIRYITVKADKDSEKVWYGMDMVDPSKPVTVVEGPLDSLFLDNAVAMLGLSNALNIPERLKGLRLTYALDNEPRNRQVVDAMERIAESEHSVCVWSDRVAGYKDINDMVLAGMSPSAVQSEIARNSHHGIAAHIALKKWAK